MKRVRVKTFAVICALLAGILLLAPHASASIAASLSDTGALTLQSSIPAPSSSAKTAPTEPASGQAEVPDEKDEYRISHITVALARMLKLSPRTTAYLLELLNALVLFGAIAWFARLKLPVFFRDRTAGLKKQLVEARSATKDADQRLRAIEERLGKLDDEIISMRLSAERNVAHEEERFRDMLATEKDRIVTAAEQEIGSAGDAARRELKIFAAELAVTTAEQRLQMTPELDQQMIDRFLETLTIHGTEGDR
jgi:F-type H+-transporting ATPase subunit b